MKKNIFSIHHFLKKPRKKAFIAALLVLMMSLTLTEVILRHNNAMVLDEKRRAIRGELELYGNTLTITLNSSFGLLEGLHGFVQAEHSSAMDHMESAFNNLATEFHENTLGIRTFTIAPNGIHTYVYPLEGNENVLGHNLLTDERLSVRVDVERAMKTREITLSGPYELRQSGLGFVARQAVFIDDEFWGLVAMVVDIPSILSSTGLSNDNSDLIFVLEDKNGDVFFGEKKILNEQPVSYEVVLPDGSWKLSAVPRDGWDTSSSPVFLLLQILGVVISLMMAVLIYLFVNRSERLQSSVDEKTQMLSKALKNLKESEKKYRDLVELAQEGIWVIDKDSKTTFVNPSMEKMLGYDKDEMLGKDLFSFMDERGIAIATEYLERRKEGIAEQHDFEFIRKDGERIVVTMRTAPMTNEKGDYAGAIAGMLDITERKKMEISLRKSQIFNQTLLDTSPDLIYVYDIVEEKNIYSNQGIMKILGYSIEEIQEMGSKLIPSLMHPEDYVPYQKEILPRYQTAKDGEIIEHEYRMKNKGGQWRWLFSKETIFAREADGTPKQIFGLTMDISEQKFAQEEIVKNQNQLESIFKSVPAGIGMIVGRKIEFVNERFVEMVGYSEEELIGKSSRIVYANDAEFERVGKEKYAQIEEKGTGAVETIFQKKDGSLINIYLSSTPINMDDMSLGVIFSALDITERKKVEKALRESETRLRTYFNQGLLGMAISSKEKKWIEFNDALCEMSGYSREEFSNKSWAEMTYPDDLDANLVLYKQALAGEIDSYSLEKRFLRKDGSVFYAELSANAIRKPDGSVDFIMTLVSDITERKNAEKALRISEDRFSKAFHSSPSPMAIVRQADGSYLEANESFLRLVE